MEPAGSESSPLRESWTNVGPFPPRLFLECALVLYWLTWAYQAQCSDATLLNFCRLNSLHFKHLSLASLCSCQYVKLPCAALMSDTQRGPLKDPLIVPLKEKCLLVSLPCVPGWMVVLSFYCMPNTVWENSIFLCFYIQIHPFPSKDGKSAPVIMQTVRMHCWKGKLRFYQTDFRRIKVVLSTELELFTSLSPLVLKQDKSLSLASAGTELILGYCLPETLIHWLVFTCFKKEDTLVKVSCCRHWFLHLEGLKDVEMFLECGHVSHLNGNSFFPWLSVRGVLDLPRCGCQGFYFEEGWLMCFYIMQLRLPLKRGAWTKAKG